MNNEGMKILGKIDVSASFTMLHRLGVFIHVFLN